TSPSGKPHPCPAPLGCCGDRCAGCHYRTRVQLLPEATRSGGGAARFGETEPPESSDRRPKLSATGKRSGPGTTFPQACDRYAFTWWWLVTCLSPACRATSGCLSRIPTSRPAFPSRLFPCQRHFPSLTPPLFGFCLRKKRSCPAAALRGSFPALKEWSCAGGAKDGTDAVRSSRPRACARGDHRHAALRKLLVD